MPLARQIAEQWVEESATRVAAAAVLPIPIPGAHTLLCSAVEAYMVAEVARVYGHRLSVRDALLLLPSLGATALVRRLGSSIAGELLEWIPIAGWVGRSGLAAAAAYAIGNAAILHFERRFPGAEATSFQVLHLQSFIRQAFALRGLPKLIA